jgi:hypothetical protein
MSSFRIRPQFTHTVDSSLAVTREQILRALAQQAPGFEVRAFPEFIAIHFAEGERRYWSPRLFLNLDTTEAGVTRIEGVYGPEMEIWSVFVYGYLATGLLGTFAGILGFAQRAVGAEPWGLWVLAAMLVVAVLLYLGAQLGQKLGAWQTFQLHRAYEAAVGRPADVH